MHKLSCCDVAGLDKLAVRTNCHVVAGLDKLAVRTDCRVVRLWLGLSSPACVCRASRGLTRTNGGHGMTSSEARPLRGLIRRHVQLSTCALQLYR